MKRLMVYIAFKLSRLYLRYAPTRMGKEFIWRYLCLRYINWREIETIETTKFGFRLRCNSEDLIQARIIYFGEWEPNLTSFLRRRLKNDDVFIDIGANIGYYSILAAQLVGPLGAVLAIEASPSIYRRLLDNVDLNQAANVRAVNVAVADSEGVVMIYGGDSSNIGATTTLAARGYRPEREVRCARLIDIANITELKRARVIKIDVEGAEAPILEDLIRNIGKLHPDVEIVVEISSDGATAIGRTWQSLFDEFAVLGFHAYELPNDYTIQPYISQLQPAAPSRLVRLPDQQFDVVLSRHVGDKL